MNYTKVHKNTFQYYLDNIDMELLETIDAHKLLEILYKCQKPKQILLYNKLLNDGWIVTKTTNDLDKLGLATHYEKGFINIITYEKGIIVKIGEYTSLRINDINNHDKVFEAVDILTKWHLK